MMGGWGVKCRSMIAGRGVGSKMEFRKDSEYLLAGLTRGPAGRGNLGVGVSPYCPGWEPAFLEAGRTVGSGLGCLFGDCR